MFGSGYESALSFRIWKIIILIEGGDPLVLSNVHFGQRHVGGWPFNRADVGTYGVEWYIASKDAVRNECEDDDDKEGSNHCLSFPTTYSLIAPTGWATFVPRTVNGTGHTGPRWKKSESD